MADTKLTALTETTTLADTDEMYAAFDVATTPVSRRITWASIKALLKTYFDALYSALELQSSGWISAGETWTRTGNYTFTVTGDVTAKYRKGTKVRYKDGGSYEYGVVLSSAYSAPNTTVTLFTNTDYAMAAATITDNYISYISNPDGYPHWFNWTPGYTGFSVDPTTTDATFRVDGRTVFVDLLSTGGTSNTTAFTVTGLPAAPVYGHNFPWGTATDNGAVLTAGGRITISAGATTATIRSNMATGAWTNSGAKSVNFDIFYYF